QAYRDATEYAPHNSEAEAALLGALMIDNRLVERIQFKLRADHFFEAVHGRIYERIAFLVGRGKRADPITLRPYFDGEMIVFGPSADGTAADEIDYGRYMAGLTGSGAGLI